MTPEDIRSRFAAQRAQGLRHKDAAETLGISEGVAIAAHAGTTDGALAATPLRGPWLELLKSLEPCGPLLALTRNASTVHEKTGVYEKIAGTGGHVAIALGEAIDLRLFLQHWFAGFAVAEGQRLSLQFFDVHGMAVHKIFVREATNRPALEALIAAHAAAPTQVAFAPAAPGKTPCADAKVDVEGLRAAWGAMQDTHDFFGLLGKFGLERQQSFRLVEGHFTRRVPARAVRALLQEAAFDGTPIMVFVGSPGCIQIHTGPVVRVEPLEIRGAQWLNILDPGFNLHLREDHIAGAWVVEKPTTDGVVTSVEAFDHDGELMAMFFGARKPGKPELEAWRQIVRKLDTATATA